MPKRKRGTVTRLAKETSYSKTHICDVLNRHKRPSPDLAVKLETVTGIPRLAWLYPDENDNPLMTGVDGETV